MGKHLFYDHFQPALHAMFFKKELSELPFPGSGGLTPLVLKDGAVYTYPIYRI